MQNYKQNKCKRVCQNLSFNLDSESGRKNYGFT